MIVKVDNETIQIVFIKEHDTYKYGKFKGKDKLNTICRIFHIRPVTKDLRNVKLDFHESNSEDIIQVGIGQANLNEKDTYNKVKGKKIALARALKHSLWGFLTKERRKIIWDRFKKEFNIDRPEIEENPAKDTFVN